MAIGAVLSAFGQSVRGLLLGGIARGLTGNAIEAGLKAAGLSFRRTVFLADMRILRDVTAKSDRIKNVRHDRRVSDDILPFHPGKQRRAYAFDVTRSGLDPESGKRVEDYVTISTNERLTPDEMMEKARGIEEHYGEMTGIDIDEMHVTGGRRQRPDGGAF